MGTRFTLFALFVVSVLAFLDRQLLNILVAPMRADLRISDAQFSLLQGAAFALTYCLAAFPIAWLSDRVSRKTVIMVSVAVWSIATLLFGLASGLGLLLAARMAVALGEAGLSPAAISILRQSYPVDRQAFAMGALTLSVYVGGGASLAIGGPVLDWLTTQASDPAPGLSWLSALAPWRWLFVACAVLGILGVVLMAFMHEPERQPVPKESTSLAAFLTVIKDDRAAIMAYLLAFTAIAALVTAATSWTPTLFIRDHEWSARQTGAAYGAVYLVCGAIGALGGGKLISDLAARGHRDALIRTVRASILLLGVATMASCLVPHPLAALAAAGAGMLAVGAVIAAGPYGFQALFPRQFSARAVALYFLVPGTIGTVLGPSSVPLLARLLGAPEKIGMPLALCAVVTMVWAWACLTIFLRLQARRPARPATVTP
ncbi:MFS transporter [Niveispirillum sp.]|uniref:MFS transporter n=1 Tax=Niveispirillum sp. TaxID=1917217 RepID=UPI001B64C353|nr:MFS transporter [Niveispirillum sp.]MBP7334291.1 MFS transporter [Niveispirillum sp.]